MFKHPIAALVSVVSVLFFLLTQAANLIAIAHLPADMRDALVATSHVPTLLAWAILAIGLVILAFLVIDHFNTNTKQTLNQLDTPTPEFAEHVPDVRIADYPSVLALFEGREADRLFPLLEAEKIWAWARPSSIGEPPPTKLPGAIWRTHYLQFLPSGAQWTRNQTYLKEKNGSKSTYYDIFFNIIQLQKVWPTLKFIEVPSRISLHDFVFAESAKVGWQRDGVDDKTGFMTLLTLLQQAAVDGLVHFSGKKTADVDDLISSPLVPIPAIYWHDHEIDVISTIYHANNENFSKRRLIPHDQLERFFDLHLNRREALDWLNGEGRPST